ncbi:MAG: hypothetical protein OFPI_30350 [Osedax symbiont Rs2]|nr:MAG: hypothetical protein OFPI_30350 [Osedax symbiont Rs2]
MNKKTLAFLHTSSQHVETFSNIINGLNVDCKVVHEVDESLLERAIDSGLRASLKRDINSQMCRLARDGAAVVVCTCSTIGAIAEQSSDPNVNFMAMRIDRAMADKAVSSAEHILVVAALESTLQPTLQLLKGSAINANTQVQITTVTASSAWELFEAGETEKYYQCIAQNISEKHHDYELIILAQASMAGAIDYCRAIPKTILSSPVLGVLAALEQLKNPSQ